MNVTKGYVIYVAAVGSFLLGGCQTYPPVRGTASSPPASTQKTAGSTTQKAIGHAGTGSTAAAAPSHSLKSAKDVFYVYADKDARVNHFAPSGWMGDYGDLKIDDGYTKDVYDGKTAIKITYTAEGTQGANWAGIYWQHPVNNWGAKTGGYDLSGMKKLTFWAKGGRGGETIAEFKVGGITGEHGDSDSAKIGPVVLTREWKQYTIDLADKDLSHIVGGFCWSASRDDNPHGFRLYLDEIRYER